VEERRRPACRQATEADPIRRGDGAPDGHEDQALGRQRARRPVRPDAEVADVRLQLVERPPHVAAPGERDVERRHGLGADLADHDVRFG
jgi:hypothetical protein